MKCEVCGSEFEAKRADARACSPKCRKKLSRGKDVTDKSESVTDNVTDNPDPLKRITHVPLKGSPEWYASIEYRNLIEELEVKSIAQLKEEGYYIPCWKERGLNKKPTIEEVLAYAGGY